MNEGVTEAGRKTLYAECKSEEEESVRSAVFALRTNDVVSCDSEVDKPFLTNEGTPNVGKKTL